MAYFISTDELSNILSNKTVKVIDLREPEKYLQGHIPQAINVDSNMFFSKTPDGFITLPDVGSLESYLRKKGINDKDTLVLVDDVFNLNCSLAAWIFHYYNHQNVMLLDGALTKWIIEKRPMTTETHEYEEGDINLTTRNEDILITRDELLMSIQSKEYLIVDNRSEYALESDNMGGKIPGAIHFWWMDAFEEHPDYFVLKPKSKIKNLLLEKGIHEGVPIILYCETAPESALMYLILKELGYRQIKLYLGGYEEWRLYCSFI